MTAGEAIGLARAMRPGCPTEEEKLKGWLRREDGEIRARIVLPGGAGQAAGLDEVGADLLWDEGLADSAVLLAPCPFDGLYPHYLAAMMDADLGENERYAGEMTRCNALLGEFAAWLRRGWPPPARRLRW